MFTNIVAYLLLITDKYAKDKFGSNVIRSIIKTRVYHITLDIYWRNYGLLRSSFRLIDRGLIWLYRNVLLFEIAPLSVNCFSM